MPQDRENHTEKRMSLAQQISRMTQLYNLIDVWRRFHLENNQYTYRGNQKNNPKSRLDRIYISDNWLHQIHSAQICPGLQTTQDSPSIYCHPRKKQRPPFWRFRNTLLNDKYFVDCITTVIKYYTTLSNEGQNIHEVWDAMKQEIQLQARRYDDN
jgi:hypothetical protein